MYLDDRHVLEIADIGHAHVDRLVHARRAIVGRRGTRRRRVRAFLDFLRGANAGRRSVGVDGEQQGSFGHLVAHLDFDLLHHAVDWRRHFHRRLVRFERDERGFHLDRLARLHQDLDDRHIAELADIRDFHFNERWHGKPLDQNAPHVREQTGEMVVEACRRRTVDDAVVPR